MIWIASLFTRLKPHLLWYLGLITLALSAILTLFNKERNLGRQEERLTNLDAERKQAEKANETVADITTDINTTDDATNRERLRKFAKPDSTTEL